MYSKTKRLLAAGCASLLMVFSSAPAYAGGLLRDAEIEATLRQMADPIFETAGIVPASDVRIFLVNDEAINAFVAGGLNMFIHTGLIKKATTPEMLYGVLAHETGHIAGAHLSKLRDISRRATIGSIIGAIVGVGAMAGGAGGAGAGVLAGSQSMAMRTMLSDIRVNEQAADHAALEYLDGLNISASGMQDMFTVLRRQERGRNMDPYLLSHPLSKDRVTTVRNHVMQSSIPYGNVPDATISERYARMRAKLIGFTDSKQVIDRTYPAKDTSFAARYARAIAAYRFHEGERAMQQMQALVQSAPNDAYLLDTQGQICFELARLTCAVEAYGKSHALEPSSHLIMTDYAKALLQRGEIRDRAEAINLLETATNADRTLAFAWRLLATAYGKDKRMGDSYFALAHERAATGNYKDSLIFLKKARPLLKHNPQRLQLASDLEQEATREIKRAAEERSLF